MPPSRLRPPHFQEAIVALGSMPSGYRGKTWNQEISSK